MSIIRPGISQSGEYFFLRESFKQIHIQQCPCLPPWKFFGVLLNVYCFQQINYLLVAWAICIVCTAILEILGAVNVFVTVTEKKLS